MENLWIVMHRSANMTHTTLDILLYFFPSINQWGVAAGTAKVWQWKVALSPTVTFVSPDTMVNTGFAKKNQIPSIMITPRHDDIFYGTNPIHGGPMIISRSPERATNAERCCFFYVGLDNLLKNRLSLWFQMPCRSCQCYIWMSVESSEPIHHYT